MKELLKHHRVATLILCLFVALGCLYSIVYPVLEASDEIHHYPYVSYLAHGNGLPVQRAGEQTLWKQEGSQPPLYYALAAGLTFWINTDDLPQLRYTNPHATVGIPLLQDNKNMIVHTEREAFPWHGTTLAVHLIRLFSVLLGAGTILCTYRLGRMLFPGRPAIAAGTMALNAFIPMYLFISASVNNDNLSIFLSALTLVVLAQTVLHGASRRMLVALGVLLGLACLTKLSTLGLAPLACLALALRRLQVAARAGERITGRDLWRWAGDCALVAIPVVLVAGWWYVRNWQLYGDPTGLNAMLDIAGRRTQPPNLLKEFEGFRINFWGLFGAVNVLLRPAWIYRLLDGLSVVAGLGLLLWLGQIARSRRLPGWPALLVLATWVIVEFVSLLRWTSMTPASQGRLMYPTLPALCLFMAIGLVAWLPARGQPYGAALMGGMMFLLAASAPFTTIMPTYARPDILTPADVPASAHPFNVDYGKMVRLLAYDVDKERVQPGGPVEVTVYWQALAPIERDYSIFLQLFGVHQDIGQRDVYPGRGLYPTSQWRPGQVIRDTFQVFVRDDARGPGPIWIAIGLYELESGKRPQATDLQGKEVIYPTLTKIELDCPVPTLVPSRPLDANLQNQVRLIGYDLESDEARPGEEMPLTLYWQVTGKLDADYKVFVHLTDAQGKSAGQGDGFPVEGSYHTSAWTEGEIINDTHPIAIQKDASPGTYQISVGLYDPEGGQRLNVLDLQGNPSGTEVPVTAVHLSRP